MTDRRRPLKPCLGFIAAILAFDGSLSQAAPSRTPNIVLIFADDVGYGDLGCYGGQKVQTPNLDRLAAEGRRFTDAHSASAVCSPSRYALLTGEYPFRKDIWGPIPNSKPLLVDVEQTTIASLLKQSGYATACFGKWHLGFGVAPKLDWNAELKPGPLELGFDHYFGLPLVNSHPPFVLVEDHRVLGLTADDPLVYGGVPPTKPYPAKMLSPGISGGKAAHDLYRDEELGTTLTEKATAWIREHRDGPFFLYFATPQIHHPFTPHPRFVGTSGCGPYGDFLHELDWMVGEVGRTLDELKLRDDTLFIFTSDNGGMLNEGGRQAWKAGHRLNGDLLGFKFDSWEGGHRVPMITRWPGRIAAGSESNQLICHVDFLATLAALVGGKLAEADGPDSYNVLSAWLDEPSQPVRDHVVLAPLKPANLAVRQGDWVYIGAQGGGGFQQKNPGDHGLGGPAALKFAGETNSDVEDGRFKSDAPVEQLYDLSSDPRQCRNVVREHPAVAANLKALLERCRNEARTAPVR